MNPAISIKLPRSAWVAVIRATFVIIPLTMLASLVATDVLMSSLSEGLNLMGAITALVMPVLLGTPMLVFLLVHQQMLKQANRQLQHLAATDWLTSCLNRRAFTLQVNERLAAGVGGQGALLIVDADHFKRVNDRFGHDHGDTALQLMVGAVQSVLGPADLLGRLGGEEFGIFLDAHDPSSANLMAERLRHAVAALEFSPAGEPYCLSISIGGACFVGPVAYADLFAVADQCLYQAKQTGRNRADLAAMHVLEARVSASRAA